MTATGLSSPGPPHPEHADYGAGELIVCDRLVRIYTAEGIEVQALQGLDLLVSEGELTALVGASGSGKSTLMNILAGLDTPTAGAVRVAGNDLAAMTARQRLLYRRSVVGFIWQQTARNLLPYLTAFGNVELPLRLAGTRRPARRARAGELDSATAASVFNALQAANAALGVTVLVVTHDPALIDLADTVLHLEDGVITPNLTPRHATTVPVVAVRLAYSSDSCFVSGPGAPEPIARPSKDTTGASPPIVPVTKASAALYSCGSV